MTEIGEIKNSLKVIFDYQAILNKKLDLLIVYMEKLLDASYIGTQEEEEEDE